MSDSTNLNNVIDLGTRLGADKRTTTARRFYEAVSDLFPNLTGKALRSKCDAISVRVAAKRLGIPQNQVSSLTKAERSAASPSGATIARFVGYVRRFPDFPADTSLEVAAKFAAQDGADDSSVTAEVAAARHAMAAEAAAAELGIPTSKLDVDGNADHAAAYAAVDRPVSIREARDAFSDPGTGTKRDTAESVSDKVAWLISQPKAVAAYVADETNATDIATLVAMLTN